ncbi:hypothetical protein [Psychroserpens sp.]|uniref:hypothetical protein n=1 Tax=Psychroserpens sp. TaxID=2020870 RepID=UPI0039E42EDC
MTIYNSMASILEDKKGATLVYSKSLEANIPLWKIVNGEAVGVDTVDWDGLRANVIRKDSIYRYNFQFLLDAFVWAKATSVAVDTRSTSLPLLIGKLNFSTVYILFNNAVTGIDSRFQIGKLEAHIPKKATVSYQI